MMCMTDLSKQIMISNVTGGFMTAVGQMIQHSVTFASHSCCDRVNKLAVKFIAKPYTNFPLLLFQMIFYHFFVAI